MTLVAEVTGLGTKGVAWLRERGMEAFRSCSAAEDEVAVAVAIDRHVARGASKRAGAHEMIAAGHPARRPAFADRAIGFMTRACAALIEGPNCCACGMGKAETGWMLDALGGAHGFCGQCARQAGTHAHRNG
jgi:hypothetical protein